MTISMCKRSSTIFAGNMPEDGDETRCFRSPESDSKPTAPTSPVPSL
eukprot:CAMPEP_0184739040 /NCGR_PEP_ID=MMETSP0315-20130426/1830_1 /TAXON_ID=101924 /ORGANISM="Rhodosorus marinus, Strain UTEX LB 2760" /LENGTH=46 /DNA_ID= /DNA_START= /DNA_END= /DNA_ORIENTATION=